MKFGGRTFRAEEVSVAEIAELNTLVCVLAERRDGRGARLEIQRSIVFDVQDKARGMETYCVSTEDGASHYGGIVSWSVDEELLTIVLDAPAAEELGFSGFSVGLSTSNESRQLLRSGLQKITSVTSA